MVAGIAVIGWLFTAVSLPSQFFRFALVGLFAAALGRTSPVLIG
jgi:hypothetical protein